MKRRIVVQFFLLAPCRGWPDHGMTCRQIFHSRSNRANNSNTTVTVHSDNKSKK